MHVFGFRLRSTPVFLTLIYILANLLILACMDSTANFRLAADGSSWFLPAKSIFENDTLFIPGMPQADAFRSPGTPIFFAAVMWLAGSPSVIAIVLAQIVLLYLTALLFRATVKDWLAKYADLGMSLILFNPSLLGMAYFTQSETFGCFTAMVALFFLLKVAKFGPTWSYTIALGLSLGATCLVRTNPIYLVYMLPIVFWLLFLIQRPKGPWYVPAIKGLAATLIAVAVMLPWAAQVYEMSGKLGLSALISPRAEFEYLYDQLIILEAVDSNISTFAAAEKLTDGRRKSFAQSYGTEWDRMDSNQQYVLLKRQTIHWMLDYPLSSWARALGLSMAQFYFGGGAGAWHNLFDVFPSGMVQAFSGMPKLDVVAFIKAVLSKAPVGALTISALCFAFVAATRIALVFGVIELCRRRQWDLLLLLTTIIIYFGLSALFQGQARYRASIEPELMLLAIAGFAFFWERRLKAIFYPGASARLSAPQ